MLSELCKELKNWFIVSKYIGTIQVEANSSTLIGCPLKLMDGQYFRVVGSVFSDGIYKYPHSFERDEVFNGAIWAMAIPEDVIALSAEIDQFNEKYGDNSPYQSESFGGYSYTKSTDKSDWRGAFSDRLNRWRKI